MGDAHADETEGKETHVDVTEFVECFAREDVIEAAARAEFELGGNMPWESAAESVRDVYRATAATAIIAALKKVTAVATSKTRHPSRTGVVPDAELTEEERSLRNVRDALAPYGVTSITFVDDDGDAIVYPLVPEPEESDDQRGA